MSSFRFFSLTSVESTFKITLNPKEQFAEDLEVRQNFNRAVSGKLHTYKIANSKQFKYTVPLSFVSSEDKLQINSWWSAQSELIFQISDSDTSGEHISVRIININNPFAKRSNQQFTKFEGFLRLASTSGGDKNEGFPFILDDAIYGLLDQDYNPLL